MSNQNINSLQSKLVAFGLSASEAAIYLYLLENGREAGGSSIALKTKLHRQYVYKALPRLIEMGFVSVVPKGKQSKYIAEPPLAVERLGRKQAVRAADLARDLESISNIGNEQDFEVIQGEKSVRQHELDYVDSIKEPYEELIIGDASNGFQKVMGDYLEEYLTMKQEKGVIVKYIGGETETKDYLATIGTFENQLYRYLKKLPAGVANIVIRPKSVCFFSYAHPPHVYVVKSQTVADHYKDFFAVLWDMSVEPKKPK